MPARPDPAPLRRDSMHTLEIDALGAEGDGIARLDGYVVLVPGALAGERVLVRITSAARKFGRGEVVQVLRAAPERVAPRCRHFLDCGGCQLQHLDGAAQGEHKRGRLQQVLDRALGDAAPRVAAMQAPDEPWGQRHKVVLHLEGAGQTLRGGFRRARRPDLVALDECPASDPHALGLGLDAVEELKELDLPAADRPGGLLRSVLVRRSAATGEAALVVVATRAMVPGLLQRVDELHRLGATVVAVNENTGPTERLLGPRTRVLSGPPRIRERIAGTTFLLSPTAFFQTSPWGAERLVELVRAALRPSRRHRLLDLYCGGGLFALCLAGEAAEVLGIEENPPAVADAEAAAGGGGIDNARFVAGRAGERLAGLRRSADRPLLVVLDPPRAGCGPEVARRIAALGPERIAYVSCDPDALGRDAAAFAAAGYRLATVTPVDMFPQTWHVEAVASLVAGGTGGGIG